MRGEVMRLIRQAVGQPLLLSQVSHAAVGRVPGSVFGAEFASTAHASPAATRRAARAATRHAAHAAAAPPASQQRSQGSGGRQPVIPRALNHLTKKQLLEASAMPSTNEEGPLQAIMHSSQADTATSNAPSNDTDASSSSIQPEYNDMHIWKQILMQGSSDERRMELARLLRRYNYSMPGLRGQAILAKVLRVNKDKVLVDPGFYGVAEVPRADITLASVRSDSSPAAAGSQEPSAAALVGRTGLSDVRAGDTVSLRVEALFTPYGDMALGAAATEPAARRAATWRELAEARAARTPVLGRVLNACTGGYAVGVGGVVALLPYGRFTMDTVANVGTLQAFLIEMVDEGRGVLAVADVRKGASRRLI